MPIAITKLYLPSLRPNSVRRPRLMERLTTGLRRRLTLNSAPADFGKTMLVSEWLAAGKSSYLTLGSPQPPRPKYSSLTLVNDLATILGLSS